MKNFDKLYLEVYKQIVGHLTIKVDASDIKEIAKQMYKHGLKDGKEI